MGAAGEKEDKFPKMVYESGNRREILRGDEDQILQLGSEEGFLRLLVDSSDEEENMPVPKPFVTHGETVLEGAADSKGLGGKGERPDL